MPALRLFGRRWMVSSDDVPVLAFGPTVFHGAWCIAIFVGWVALNVPSHCDSGVKYSVSLAGLAFTFLANFLIGAWLMHEGLKGVFPLSAGFLHKVLQQSKGSGPKAKSVSFKRRDTCLNGACMVRP